MEMCHPLPKLSRMESTSPLSGGNDDNDPLFGGPLEFPEPIIPVPTPQSPFHILCTIADVEAYFRGQEPASPDDVTWQRRWECFYEGVGRCRLSETFAEYVLPKGN